jgi:predicted methyltransferase
MRPAEVTRVLEIVYRPKISAMGLECPILHFEGPYDNERRASRMKTNRGCMMKADRKYLFTLLILSGLALTAQAQAQSSDSDLMSRMHQAMMAPGRPADDKALDAKRKPEEVLAYFGLKPGMQVIDISAATGYYSELLAAAVGPTGTVYAQNSQRMAMNKDAMKALNERVARMPNIKPTDVPETDIGMDGKLDFALVSLHLHDVYNFGGKDAALAMLRGIYASLKPGGKLGLIDHIGNAGADNRTLHRIPMETAEDLLTEAGFKIEGQSNVLRHPEDDHTLPSSDEKIRRMTDRMVVLAMKPE